MRAETLTESQPKVLTLTRGEARGLAAVGARLAPQKGWGAADADADAAEGRTIVRVQPVGPEQWAVRVSDAVGVIAVRELQLQVSPKIPPDHLLHLLARGGELPRLDEAPLHAAVSPSLWELVARAFVEAAERLLRLGLIRDYRELADTLDAASGGTAYLRLHGSRNRSVRGPWLSLTRPGRKLRPMTRRIDYGQARTDRHGQRQAVCAPRRAGPLQGVRRCGPFA